MGLQVELKPSPDVYIDELQNVKKLVWVISISAHLRTGTTHDRDDFDGSDTTTIKQVSCIKFVQWGDWEKKQSRIEEYEIVVGGGLTTQRKKINVPIRNFLIISTNSH